MDHQLDQLISVIIPLRNAERHLAETVESVLAQTYRPVEVIVADGGSTDGSAAVARSFPTVRYVLKPDRCAAEGRNHGAALARGGLLAFLEADDLWAADKLERQAATLAARPELDAVFAHGEQFYSSELAANRRDKIFLLAEPVATYHPNTMLIRRAAFWRVGPFDASLTIADSLDWCVRARQGGLRSVMLPDVLYRKRVHGTNQGLVRSEHRGEYLRVVKAALSHERGRGDKSGAPA